MSERERWLPTDDEIAAKLPDRPLYESYGEEFDPADLYEPIRALIREAVRAHDHERFRQYLLDMRGVDGEPCADCGGVGVKAYANTATWRGGIGGQAFTNSVCDKCWGSGDAARPWLNLRSMMADQNEAIRTAVARALAEQEAGRRREVIEALIYELDNATSTVCQGCAEGIDYWPADGSHRRQISDDGDCEGGPCNCHELSDRLHGLRAELAALEEEADDAR